MKKRKAEEDEYAQKEEDKGGRDRSSEPSASKRVCFFLFWGVRVQCELILVSNHAKLKITSVASKFNADATAVHNNNEKRRKNP